MDCCKLLWPSILMPTTFDEPIFIVELCSRMMEQEIINTFHLSLYLVVRPSGTTMNTHIATRLTAIGTAFVTAIILFFPAGSAITHYEETYQEYEGDGTLVGASAGWEYEQYQGELAGRARGTHTSIGLPASGSVNVCGSNTYCDNIVGTCVVPTTSETLGAINCESHSGLLYTCAWDWAETVNSIGESVRSLTARSDLSCE